MGHVSFCDCLGKIRSEMAETEEEKNTITTEIR